MMNKQKRSESNNTCIAVFKKYNKSETQGFFAKSTSYESYVYVSKLLNLNWTNTSG